MKPFVLPNCSTRDTQELCNSLQRVFNSLEPNPLLNNPNVIKGQVFGLGTDLIVNHKLNRAIVGFIPVNLNAAAILYVSPTTNPLPNQQIILRASAAVTADILFF